ncbi:hypothetical protein CVU83_02380 [Candidatus Falkowbacteria bacterium HGW-Falkowbacteria-2]|uniref:beta-glucosidase n=1 Tax=Candidatus Falkowbacteria bacterium HGW-Falkowbacteria-2 TaxID=2013769 RepID=A0A2N2DZP8_9BACT|nr:MAG: hypothetical protein CVU83_02380 [Candidatus Falkowbacteria bacterium HGW-Falkowbacteria-2]
MLPYDYPKFKADMEQAILSGRLSQERLDDAVRRVLRVKFNLGLFERQAPLISDLGVVGSRAHRELAREAVRRSLVLLKDDSKILPLPKSASYIVAGSSADNVGRQSGGWTIDWQGVDGNPLPGATSILAGIKQALPLGAKIDYDRDGNFNLTEKAEYGIVIVGEQPYAEGVGDKERPHLSAEDLAVIERVRQLAEKLVVIIVAGRPLDIRAEARQWDAVIAAWLPGSEGQGVSDVLFGDYPFTGELPIPWEL